MATTKSDSAGNNSNTKVHADFLIINGLIVTMDAKYRILDGGALAVKDGEIVALGTTAELQNTYEATQVIDATGKLVMPGLINTHTHSPMTIFRGYADDLHLKEWLYDHIFPIEAEFVNPENVRTGTRLAIAEMLLSGTTTFNDMYYYVDEMATVVDQVGIRAVLTESLIDFSVPNSPSPEHALAVTEKLINKWNVHPLITIGISAHAPYTTSPEVIKKGKDLSDKYQLPFNIHISETRGEFDMIQKEYGMTPVRFLDEAGVLGPNVVAAHCVHVTPEDIEIFAKRGVGVAHNPQCNMKLASGVAPVPEFLKAGVKVGIGTDGVASNNDLDLFDEVRSAAFIHKLNSNDPTVLDAQTAIGLATMGGARVLGMEHLIGSLETGKRADIIILDMDQPHAHPVYNIYSLIVYSIRGSDVETVLVDGKLMVHNRKLVTLDLDRLYDKVEQLAKQITEKSTTMALLNNRLRKL
ncbi:MAG: amidohydrolase [Bacteroides sp.]|jgi:5-methylthioadenosine/S-adenosylhomocysteine deaminase|nr:amidohydrolase [Bacteroides sp.]